MKVSLNKPELALAIARTQGTISDRTLAYISLKADDNRLIVSAADRVLLVYSAAQATVTKVGTVFVPAKIFSDVVRELPDGLVVIEDLGHSVAITAGKDKEFLMKLPKVKEKEWKDPPVIDSQNFADLPSEKLYYVIDQVQFCVAHESPRNYGSVGFFHKTDNNRLRLVGTDGFRLSYSEIDVELPKAFLEAGVCLSKRALNELQRMSAEGFSTIRIAIASDNTTLMASAQDYQIFVRLSAVKYPNYQGVLPKSSLTPIEVSRSHLQSVAKRVLLAADKSRALQMHFSDSMLTLKSRSQGTSEGMERIPLKDYAGGDRDLAINGKFLTDVFSTITSNEVTLNIKSEDDPIVLVPREEPQNCHSMHVLVPIREA